MNRKFGNDLLKFFPNEGHSIDDYVTIQFKRQGHVHFLKSVDSVVVRTLAKENSFGNVRCLKALRCFSRKSQLFFVSPLVNRQTRAGLGYQIK